MHIYVYKFSLEELSPSAASEKTPQKFCRFISKLGLVSEKESSSRFTVEELGVSQNFCYNTYVRKTYIIKKHRLSENGKILATQEMNLFVK